MYAIDGFKPSRNDSPHSNSCTRPYGGMALYVKVFLSQNYFYCKNSKGIEVIVFRVTALKQFMVIGLYRSPKVPMTQLCAVLRELLNQHSLTCNIVLGDFNVNWLN